MGGADEGTPPTLLPLPPYDRAFILQSGDRPETGFDVLGLKDLEPDSKLIKRLRRLKCRRVDARYLTLAGENQIPEEQGLLERLWRKVMLGIDVGLDAFYEGQNDGVIPVKSMRRLRKKDFAALKKANLPCHHFGYFQADPHRPDGPTEIGAWMCS